MINRYVFASALLATFFVGCAGALEGTRGKPDRIVVQTQEDPDTAYRNAARALLDMGYALSSSDETLRTITTEYRETERGVGLLGAPMQVKVSVFVNDSSPATVAYRGTYRSSSFGDEELPVVKRGMGGSPSMNAWEELERAAASYPGGTVTTRTSQ